MSRTIRAKATYHRSNDLTLRVADCRKFLKDLPRECAQLVVTSPPYNIEKSYEGRRVALEHYLDMQREVIELSIHVLKDGGSLCWQVGHHINESGHVIPIDMLLWPLFEKHANAGTIRLRNRIVWHFEHGLHCTSRFSGRHETILWFTKGNGSKFNLDSVRVPQKYPGKRAYKGPRKGEFSGNPLGKNPGDVWSFPNVKANHVEKTIHPCQFPIELVERLVLSLTDKNDLVVDPFAGAGSALVAALLHGRRAAGCDLVREYTQIAKTRARQAFVGTVPHRPYTAEVQQPSVGSLTVRPSHFRKPDSELDHRVG